MVVFGIVLVFISFFCIIVGIFLVADDGEVGVMCILGGLVLLGMGGAMMTDTEETPQVKIEQPKITGLPLYRVTSAKNDTLDIYTVNVTDRNNNAFTLTLPLLKLSALGIDADSVLIYSEL